MPNLLSYTPSDCVLNSFVMKQQLNTILSAFHIETEVPGSSTFIPSTSTRSTSIQDVLKPPEPSKRKTTRQEN